ncbi:MAG: hypothetical protein K2M95_03055 [Clostridiales bacterium]|nr:hypothetical protein [Clostridiales bacterium]
MLREEWIERAAAVHAVGARMLRDGVAVTLPCLPVGCLKAAFACERVLADAERNLSCVLSLSQGLIGSGLTKFTAACEARTRLLGVGLDASLLSMQAAAEKGIVQPGTRTDIFDGFTHRNLRAVAVCDAFTEILEDLIRQNEEGFAVLALPAPALRFIKRTVTDYRAACNLLAAGEYAVFLRRADLLADLLTALQRGAAECVQQEEPCCETLASFASSGKLTVLPPLLYDMALRYERLPAFGYEKTEPTVYVRV